MASLDQFSFFEMNLEELKKALWIKRYSYYLMNLACDTKLLSNNWLVCLFMIILSEENLQDQ